MKLNKIYFVTTLLALTACGKAAVNAPASSASATQAPLLTNGSGNNYVTASTLRYEGGELPSGTSVTMLESKNGYVHLGVDSDDERVPSEVWAKAEDIGAASLLAQAEHDVADEESLIDDFAKGGGMTYCYRYVKQYLLNKHLVNVYLPGVSAWMAGSELARRGWHRLPGGPESTRVNDVCVYRGGKGGNGHVEVRVQGGWYYGYGVKSHPMSRQTHPFVGCFRK